MARHIRFPERWIAAFRNRDWFGVFVEFAAVVFGVLLALQANQWAETRREAREREMLTERLVTDLRDYSEANSEVGAGRAKRVAEIAWLMNAMDDGSIDEVDVSRRAKAIDSAISFAETPTLPITLTNLMSSESLARVDPAIRIKLEDLVRLQNRQVRGTEMFNDHARSHFDLIEQFVPLRTDRLGDGEFDILTPEDINLAMLEDPEVRLMIGESLRRDRMLQLFNEAVGRSANVLADEIEKQAED